MAAHVLTAINQLENELLTKGTTNWAHLDAALNIMSWTEDLDYEHYRSLLGAVRSENVIRLAMWLGEVKATYMLQWHIYGEPKTREEWIERKYV